MVSNERLEEIIGQFEHVIYPAEVGEMARELLALKSLPAMAEVDALWEKWYQCFDDSQDGRVEELHLAARSAIASAHAEKTEYLERLEMYLKQIGAMQIALDAEKVRADEAESKLVEHHTVDDADAASLFLEAYQGIGCWDGHDDYDEICKKSQEAVIQLRDMATNRGVTIADLTRERDEVKAQMESVEATRTAAVNGAVKWANEADEAVRHGKNLAQLMDAMSKDNVIAMSVGYRESLNYFLEICGGTE